MNVSHRLAISGILQSQVQLFPTLVSPALGEAIFTGYPPSILFATNIATSTGSPIFTGYAPVLSSVINTNTGQPIFTGFVPTVTITPTSHPLILDVNGVVSVDYSANFDNVSYTNTLTTTGSGTQIDTGSLRFSDDVVCTVTKTDNAGLAEDVVDILFQVNGVTVHTEPSILLGDPVSVVYTFTGLIGLEELKVVVTEG